MSRFRAGRRLAGGMAAVALLAACLAVSGVASADGPASPGEKYRDTTWKFSISVFEDWDQVPLGEQSATGLVDPIEKAMVARFAQRDDAVARGRARSGVLHVYRMGKARTAETTGEPKAPPTPKVPFREAPKPPASMSELLLRICQRLVGAKALDPKAAKDVKSKDGVPGSMWTFENGGAYLVAALWKKDDAEIGMFVVCDASLRKKYEVGFGRVVTSFTWFDEKAGDVKSLDVLEGVKISAKKRRQIEKGLVSGWDVVVSPKKNYVVIYNRRGRRNDKLARVIAERIELIRAQVYETLFPPAKPVEAVSIVRVCGDAPEYHAYGGPGGSAGYWSDDTEELVFYDANPKKTEPDDNTLAVLYHEAFHQYIYYSVGNVAPHSWFNEGHGDYFAGARFLSGKFTIKPFNWRVKRVKDAIDKGPCPGTETTDKDGDPQWKYDRNSGGYTPLSALVRFTQRDYYSYPGVSYAQGWSLVYFLREIVPKNKEWNAKWGKILDTYFTTLKTEVNKETPLVPKGLEPDDGKDDAPGMGEPAMGEPGMSDPGMGEPGMSEPAMDEPGMSEPGMSEPGMSEPGMSEPGMSEPGMADPGMSEPAMDDPGMGDDPADSESSDPGIAEVMRKFESSAKALRKAVAEAFQGVNFDELEAAWKSSISKIPTPPPPRR